MNGSGTVDARNPWLGLASFTEETRGYFFGRDEEIAELARRVQRKLLTVLFGQSGLGKTSILRAGLAPRLRGQGYCPVYVRVDYAPDAPEPAEQIKRAIAAAASGSGEWTRAGVAQTGESLWEFLHHRDDVLRDEDGATLIPLLIFDQFEEIFTLAQSDEAGRARVARFVAELADLVENRPPRTLEARLESDEATAERFDFARSDYRVLIALREDYLAKLESLKSLMPSVTQNRLRLAPMNGTQALEAVLRPGHGLVTEEVAAAIVRFVAGGAELANAEVEPALLSLICRELNDARLAQGRGEISLDLLEGSRATILSNFYERSLADQPPAVRRVIEDELLTASGFRENVAEERLTTSLAAAGAPPQTLATLVNRRLLRIEARLDIRRGELTHDLLCGVVRSSRDLRREREAREATERQLAEQQTRERAARRALVRARQVAAGCALLAIGAVLAAVLAYVSTQRARHAEAQAQQTRAQAEQARGGAQQLLGYLSDDLVRELENIGRNDVIAEFSHRQMDYFHSLPAALRDRDTIRDGALAMEHFARAARQLGQLDEGLKSADEAVRLLVAQRAQGDASEATAIALARAYVARGMILDNRNDPAGLAATRQAEEMLAPLAAAPGASVPVRRAYAQVLMRRGYEASATNRFADAAKPLDQARQIALDLGAGDGSDVDMMALLAEIDGWQVASLVSLGRYEDAERTAAETTTYAERALERQPGHRMALHAEGVANGELASALAGALRPEEARRYAERGVQVSATLLKLDPHSTTNRNNFGVAFGSAGDALWAAGHLTEAIDSYSQALAQYDEAARSGGAGFVVVRSANMLGLSSNQAQLGDFTAAAQVIASDEPFVDLVRSHEGAASPLVAIVDGLVMDARSTLAFSRDDLDDAGRLAAAAIAELDRLQPVGAFQANQRDITLYGALHVRARVEYLRGDFAAAERDERAAITARQHWSTEGIGDRRSFVELSTWLAMCLAREGRLAEAAREIAPSVAYEEGLSKKNRGDRWQPTELAAALYAQALAEPPHRTALLARAAALLEAAPAAIRATHDVRQWRERVSAASSTR